MISVYLDSQDYLNLYRSNTPAHLENVKQKLLAFSDSGQVRFCFSFMILAELIQDFEPSSEADRLARASFVERLCGSSGVPFLGELSSHESSRAMSSWLPADIVSAFGLPQLQAKLIKRIRQELQVPRKLRRKVTSNSVFLELLKNNPTLLSINRESFADFPLPEAFFEKQVLRRSMLGEISEQEANQILLSSISTPTGYFKFWFKYYGQKNPLQDVMALPTEELFQNFLSLSRKVKEFQIVFGNAKNKFSEAKKLLREMNQTSVQMRQPVLRPTKMPIDLNKTPVELFDEAISATKKIRLFPTFDEIYRSYLRSIVLGKTPLKSDIMDIVHAHHIQHVDLWRGDREFCRILSRTRIPNRNRIVASLTDLPERIEELLAQK